MCGRRLTIRLVLLDPCPILRVRRPGSASASSVINRVISAAAFGLSAGRLELQAPTPAPSLASLYRIVDHQTADGDSAAIIRGAEGWMCHSPPCRICPCQWFLRLYFHWSVPEAEKNIIKIRDKIQTALLQALRRSRRIRATNENRSAQSNTTSPRSCRSSA